MSGELVVFARHPSEAFIKYLITSGKREAKDDNWITYQLGTLGLPPAEEGYIEVVRERLEQLIPSPFKPNDRYHKESRKFLHAEGIFGLHNPDAATEEANNLLTNIKARSVIEQLLLGRIPAVEISRRLAADAKEAVSPEAIECFKSYYWNVDKLRQEDWAILFADKEVKLEKIKAILDCGAGLALHLAGFREEVEGKKLIKDMLEGVKWDFEQWMTQPRSEARTRSLNSLAKSACMLDTQLNSKTEQINKAFEMLEKFRVSHSNSEAPSIADVAPAGNFTQSGVKLVEEDPDELAEQEERIKGPKAKKGTEK